MNARPELSVIIVHYHTPELLRLCLRSLEANLKDLAKEILVVDSAAETDMEETLAEEFPSVKYRPHKNNLGYAAGVNQGLKQASGQYILILNPDIIVKSGVVQAMLAHLKTHPQVGLLGPKLLDFSGARQNSCFRFYRPLTIVYRRTFLGLLPFAKKALAKFNYQGELAGEVFYPDWLMGSALLTTREAVNRVGLMDEKYFLYFEDVDWAHRFWENGYQVAYLPSVAVFHYHQRRSRAGLDALDFILRREARWHVRSGLKYFHKYGLQYRSGTELAKTTHS